MDPVPSYRVCVHSQEAILAGQCVFKKEQNSLQTYLNPGMHTTSNNPLAFYLSRACHTGQEQLIKEQQ
jgi:hypothetical protein